MLRPLSILSALLLAGCAQLATLPGAGGLQRPNPPRVSVTGVALAAAPSNAALARALCPQVANALVCRAFGGAPSAAELTFVFDVTLEVANQNSIPLPAVEAMVAFTAYPQETRAANVGAVCVALCPEGEVCGPPPADGCGSADRGLKSMADYASATVGFLASVALGQTRVSDVRVRTIPAGGTVSIRVRLELNPEAMVRLIANVASDALTSLRGGSVPSFAIPFSLEGTLWVDVESFGKIAAGFGPYADTWRLQ